MNSSSEASEPFLAEIKYRDSDDNENWGAGAPEVGLRVRGLPWLGFGLLLLLLTNATTYLLVNRTQINSDEICASYTSKWCKFGSHFVLVTYADSRSPHHSRC